MRKGLLALMFGAVLAGCDSNDGCVSVRGVVLDSLTLRPLQGISADISGGAWGFSVDVDTTGIDGDFDLNYCRHSQLFLEINTGFYDGSRNDDYKMHIEYLEESGKYERRILLAPE